MNTSPLLDAEGLVKRFGTLLANDQVSLRVMPGEAHALLGENGAGKSTLAKLLYGLLQPDAGRIDWQGRRVAPPNPRAARRLGIGMVFQQFSLFGTAVVRPAGRVAADRGRGCGRGGIDPAGVARLGARGRGCADHQPGPG